jgi:hypothetical protein
MAGAGRSKGGGPPIGSVGQLWMLGAAPAGRRWVLRRAVVGRDAARRGEARRAERDVFFLRVRFFAMVNSRAFRTEL